GYELEPDTLLGIQSESDWDVQPASTVDVLDVPLDRFGQEWSGYLGAVQAAYELPGSGAAVMIRPVRSTLPTIVQRHHLHVSRSSIRLDYSTTILQARALERPLRLRMPGLVQIESILINGSVVQRRSTIQNGQQELTFWDLPRNDVIRVEVRARLASRGNQSIDLPEIRIDSPVAKTDRYTISHSAETSVVFTQRPTIPAESTPDLNPSEALAQGWMPVATYVRSAPSRLELPPLAATIRVPRRRPTIRTRQWLDLKWNDGRWSMEATIRFLPGPIPDYIDLAIPSRWCQSLQLEGSLTQTQQPSLDTSTQLIRIRCEGERLGDERSIVVRGDLSSDDTGRLTVPATRVLSGGTHQVFVSVPTRLNQQPIQWRTSGLRSLKSLQDWPQPPGARTLRQRTDANGRPLPSRIRRAWQVTSRAWSAELVSSSNTTAKATITVADAQVFQTAESALVIAHYDLNPADEDALELEIPRKARVIAAWSAGRSMDYDVSTTSAPESQEASRSTSRKRLRIPLALSRLSQPVELMYEIPRGVADNQDYLPSGLSVSAPRCWVAFYRPRSDQSGGRLSTVDRPKFNGRVTEPSRDAIISERLTQPEGFAARQYALAESIVLSVELSLNSLAERPSEWGAWLGPWADRYQATAQAAGKSVDLLQPSPEQPNSPDPWFNLNQRMSALVQGVSSEPLANSARPLTSRIQNGFRLDRVVQVSNERLPPPIERTKQETKDIATLLFNVLTMILVAGLWALAWPYRFRAVAWIEHPATWLLTLALLSLFWLTSAIALGLLAVAVLAGLYSVRRAPSS
ncbi:MAG: hypothetical protein AAGA03_12815, partial [Planctomycetota bacterium]